MTSYDPFEPAILVEPYDAYRWLRDSEPVHHHPGHDIWTLSRYADVDGAVRDHETFSSAGGVTLVTGLGPADVGLPILLTLDPPRHDELRRLVSRAFTPRTVAGLEPRIRDISSSLLDDRIGDDTFDFMDVAAALPTIVIAELLGVPPGEEAMFRRWVETVVTIDPELGQLDEIGNLFSYLSAAVRRHREHPSDDLIGTLLAAEVDGVALSGEEILGFTFLLLVAGFETTKNLIGNGMWLLGQHPDVHDRLRREPTAITSFVEEVLRYESPVIGLGRTTTSAVELHGTTIPEGARVQLLFAAANRDEREFPRAERFEVDRDPERHLAFGSGIHYCLGAALARLEARVLFEVLLGGHPDLVPTGGTRLVSPYIRGFLELPVERVAAPAVS